MKTKLKLLITSAIILNAFNFLAQDTLHFRSGAIKAVKLMEISTNEVQYHSWNYLNGPIYIVNKDKLFLIKYSNGTVDTCHLSPQKKINELNVVGNEQIIEKNGSFIYQNTRIKAVKALLIIDTYAKTNNNIELTRLVHKTNLNKKFQKKSAIAAVCCLGIGVSSAEVGLFASLLSASALHDFDDYILGAGVSFCFIGFNLGINSIVNATVKHIRFKKTISLYNSSLHLQP